MKTISLLSKYFKNGKNEIKVNKKHFINIDSFESMEDPSSCPNCGNNIDDEKDILGVGKYPITGHRGSIGTLAVAYECSKCFTKCCHHMSIQLYESYKELLDEKIKEKENDKTRKT